MFKEDRLLTREEAAARLSLRPQTLAAWSSQSRGPRYMKLGKSVRYRQSDLDAFMEESYVSPERH